MTDDNDNLTDADHVERCRVMLQSALDEADFEAGDTMTVLDSTGYKHETRRVYAPDLKEIGRFDLRLPPHMAARMTQLHADAVKRHWVYRHVNGAVHALALPARLMLRRVGYADIHALIKGNGN